MAKSNKTAWIIGGVAAAVLIGGVGTYAYIKHRGQSPVIPPPDIDGGGNNPGWTSGQFPLAKGMYNNNDVVTWQKYLVNSGYLAAATSTGATNIDGDFGPLTETATIKAIGKATVDQLLFNTLTKGLSGIHTRQSLLS